MNNLLKEIKYEIQNKNYNLALKLCNKGLDLILDENLLFLKAFVLGEINQLEESISIYMNLLNKKRISKYLQGISRVIMKKDVRNVNEEEAEYCQEYAEILYEANKLDEYEAIINYIIEYYSSNNKKIISFIRKIKYNKIEYLKSIFYKEINKNKKSGELLLKNKKLYKENEIKEIRLNEYKNKDLVFNIFEEMQYEEIPKEEYKCIEKEYILYKIGWFYVEDENIKVLNEDISNDISHIYKLFKNDFSFEVKRGTMENYFIFGNGDKYLTDQILFSGILKICNILKNENQEEILEQLYVLENLYQSKEGFYYYRWIEINLLIMECNHKLGNHDKVYVLGNKFNDIFEKTGFKEWKIYFIKSMNSLELYKDSYEYIKTINETENADILVEMAYTYYLNGNTKEMGNIAELLNDSNEKILIESLIKYKDTIKNANLNKPIDEKLMFKNIFKAIESGYSDPRIFILLGDIYRRSNPPKSLEYYLKGFKIDKFYLFKVVDLLSTQERFSEMVEIMENTNLRSFRYYKTLGLVYFRLKNYFKAETNFKIALGYKKDVTIYLALSDSVLALNRPDNALNILNRITEDMNNNFLVKIKKAKLNNMLGNYKEAIEILNSVTYNEKETSMELFENETCFDLFSDYNLTQPESLFEVITEIRNFELLKSNYGLLSHSKEENEYSKLLKSLENGKYFGFRIPRSKNEIEEKYSRNLEKYFISNAIHLTGEETRTNLLNSINFKETAEAISLLALNYYEDGDLSRSIELIDKAILINKENCLVWAIRCIIFHDTAIRDHEFTICFTEFIKQYEKWAYPLLKYFFKKALNAFIEEKFNWVMAEKMLSCFYLHEAENVYIDCLNHIIKNSK